MHLITKQETQASAHAAPSTFKTYNEMLEQTVIEVNELERLKSNLKLLEDLHGRLQFTMTEVKSLLKRV